MADPTVSEKKLSLIYEHPIVTANRYPVRVPINGTLHVCFENDADYVLFKADMALRRFARQDDLLIGKSRD